VESPLGTVARFCEAWSRLDLDEIVGFLSDDAVYQDPPPTAGVDRVEFEVLHAAAAGDVVLDERVDRFFTPDRTIELPVMGTFEVAGGVITAWRDHFTPG
jgi:limonene-1,2-epoxide hydrolase